MWPKEMRKSNTDLICWSAAFFQFYSLLHFCVTNSAFLGMSLLKLGLISWISSLFFGANVCLFRNIKMMFLFNAVVVDFYFSMLWNHSTNDVQLTKKKNHTHVQLMKNRVFENVNKIETKSKCRKNENACTTTGWHSLNFFYQLIRLTLIFLQIVCIYST